MTLAEAITRKLIKQSGFIRRYWVCAKCGNAVQIIAGRLYWSCGCHK